MGENGFGSEGRGTGGFDFGAGPIGAEGVGVGGVLFVEGVELGGFVVDCVEDGEGGGGGWLCLSFFFHG